MTYITIYIDDSLWRPHVAEYTQHVDLKLDRRHYMFHERFDRCLE